MQLSHSTKQGHAWRQSGPAGPGMAVWAAAIAGDRWWRPRWRGRLRLWLHDLQHSQRIGISYEVMARKATPLTDPLTEALEGLLCLPCNNAP